MVHVAYGVRKTKTHSHAYLGHGHGGDMQHSTVQHLTSNYTPTMVSAGTQVQVVRNNPYHHHHHGNHHHHHHGSHHHHHHHGSHHHLPHHQQPPQMGMVYMTRHGQLVQIVPTYSAPVFVPNMDYLAANNYKCSNNSSSTDMRAISNFSSSKKSKMSKKSSSSSSASSITLTKDGASNSVGTNTSFEDPEDFISSWAPNDDFFGHILSDEFDPCDTIWAHGLTRATSRYLPMIFERNYASSDSGSSSGTNSGLSSPSSSS